MNKIKISYVIDHILDDYQILNAACDCNTKHTLAEDFEFQIIVRTLGFSRIRKRKGVSIYQLGADDTVDHIKQIITYIDEFNPDVIHMHGACSFPSYPVIINRYKGKKKLIWEFGGGHDKHESIKYLDAVLVQHELQKSFFCSVHPDKIYVRPRGVRLDIFKPLDREKKWDLIQVGGFYGAKGQENILGALSVLKVKLLLLGQHYDNTGKINAKYLQLRQFAESRGLDVTFQDFTDPMAVPEYYAQSRIAVWGGRTSGENPMTLTNRSTAEAIACGCPLVGFRRCFTNSHYIIPGKTAVLVEDLPQFVSAIRYLLGSERRRVTMAENCRVLAKQRLDFSINHDEFYRWLYPYLVHVPKPAKKKVHSVVS